MKRIYGAQYGITGDRLAEGEYTDAVGKTLVRTTLTPYFAVIVIHDKLTPGELDRFVHKLNEVRDEL